MYIILHYAKVCAFQSSGPLINTERCGDCLATGESKVEPLPGLRLLQDDKSNQKA